MRFGPRFRSIRINPVSVTIAALLALASAACEDPGVEPGREPEEQLLFIHSDGASDPVIGTLSEIYRVYPDGAGVENMTRQPGVYHHVSVSPDRRRILFLRIPGCDLWVMNVDGSGQTRLTPDGFQEDRCNGGPRWSADGTRIAFITNREGRSIGPYHDLYDVYVMNADGSNPRNVSHTVSAELGAHAVEVVGWSPSGQVVFQVRGVVNRATFARVYLVNADGTGLRTLFAGTKDHSPAWSPDGSKVAFVSERDGGWRLYLMNADGTGERPLTTHGRGDYPPGVTGGGAGTIHDYNAWSPDGTRIAFHVDHKIHVINANGTGLRELTRESAQFNGWSRDGTRIAFTSASSGQKDVYTLHLSSGEQVRLTSSPSTNRDAFWTLW